MGYQFTGIMVVMHVLGLLFELDIADLVGGRGQPSALLRLSDFPLLHPQ